MLKQFVDELFKCLTILWGWRLNGLADTKVKLAHTVLWQLTGRHLF